MQSSIYTILLLFGMISLFIVITYGHDDYHPWDSTITSSADIREYSASSGTTPDTLYKALSRVLFKFFKTFISSQNGARCRYSPTCSRYALEAINEYGPYYGLLMASDRWLRCNPFGAYGDDPIESHYYGPTADSK